MIKSIVAFTDEIDNPAAAAEAILSQIKAGDKLRKNSLAIISCHCAFLETGAYAAVSKALGMHVCGFTTSINGGGPAATPLDGSGELFMTVLVLTSDEVTFDIGISPAIKPGDDYEKAFSETLYSTEKPTLIFVTAPSIELIPGDELVETIEKFHPGVPIFGGYSVDDSPRYNENVFALADGEFYSDRVVFLKFYGDFTPRFFTASLTREKVKEQFAVVTKSNGTEIIALNDRPVCEFLDALGLSEALTETGVITNFALIIDDEETGTYYARAMLKLTPERTLICGGNIPEGAHLRVGQFEKTDAISSGALASSYAFSEKKHAVVAVSSISRATILGSDIFFGIDTLRKESNGEGFLMSYAAGEICPELVNGKFKNRFNNQSFNACVL
jgi:hypothetical protein